MNKETRVKLLREISSLVNQGMSQQAALNTIMKQITLVRFTLSLNNEEMYIDYKELIDEAQKINELYRESKPDFLISKIDNWVTITRQLITEVGDYSLN